MGRKVLLSFDLLRLGLVQAAQHASVAGSAFESASFLFVAFLGFAASAKAAH
ncbi:MULTISPECIES: hypothetical protein [unclassified Mesorhizobium]|uniref:hypothetical protein n=1 Tax=unclassified Mesorhizobium TaxID=325217 RepID=UPI0013EA84BD|nr:MULTISPECIES: hypothetical protein [unclassified Mesorhizobium]